MISSGKGFGKHYFTSKSDRRSYIDVYPGELEKSFLMNLIEGLVKKVNTFEQHVKKLVKSIDKFSNYCSGL